MSLGSSLGPTTTIATTAMTRSSDQPISNICALQARAARPRRRPRFRERLNRFLLARGFGAGGGFGGGLRALVLDDLGLLGGGLLLVGHALLEALDALGDVAHQLGDLAAPEQEHEEHKDDQNVRPAQSHCESPSRLGRLMAIGRAPVSRQTLWQQRGGGRKRANFLSSRGRPGAIPGGEDED